MTIILGIDPGLQHTGWGIVNVQGSRISFVDCGTISTSSKSLISEKLFFIHSSLTEVISKYQPAEVALEEVFFNTNAATSLKLGQARGAIMLSVAISGVDLYEYATRLVKKSIVGVGQAEKAQVLAMVKILLPGANVKGFDASDALAVAICHINHRSSRGIAK